MRALLVLSALLLAGCASPTPTADVTATFYPLAWLSEELAPEGVSVAMLVPAGIEPHDWEPAPTDVDRVAGTKLVVKQGAGFEPWLDGLLANLGDKAPRVVDTTADVDLETHEDELDPHTWLDPALLAEQSLAVEAAMSAAFPEHADAIASRGATLRETLATLDTDIAAGLETCEARVIIANHDAYGYLADRYDFEVVSVSGLSPEAEPSPADIARAVDAAREHNATIIFFEELVSPRVAEVIAKEVGATTRVLSPIETAPDEGDYVSLMRTNLVHLREAMRCT